MAPVTSGANKTGREGGIEDVAAVAAESSPISLDLGHTGEWECVGEIHREVLLRQHWKYPCGDVC